MPIAGNLDSLTGTTPIGAFAGTFVPLFRDPWFQRVAGLVVIAGCTHTAPDMSIPPARPCAAQW